MKHLFLLLISVLSLQASVYAQDTLNVNKYKAGQCKRMGKYAIMRNDYPTAAKFYARYLKLKPKDAKVAFQLAEAYRKNRDYAAGLEWYTKAYELSENTNAMALYNMAIMQKQTGDCANASKNLAKFKKSASDDPELDKFKKQLKIEIAGCDSIVKKYITGKPQAIINRMDNSINKVHVEGSPLQIADDKLFFSSLRTDERVYKYEHEDSVNTHVRKFYTATKKDNKWTYANEFEGPFSAAGVDYSNGSFTPDGNKFYFSRAEENNKGKVFSTLWVTEKRGAEWSEPTMLNELINMPKTSSTQPSATVDKPSGYDVVYFVSDREEGGKGGTDIYYFTYNPQKRKYSAAKNVGPKVNTVGDEVTPYYDNDAKILYFSSNGLPSAGGHDIFRARGELKKFTTAENLGLPINSGADDVYYSNAKNVEDGGFFVSNRQGGQALKGNATCCDDIYTFKRLEYIKLDLKGLVYEELQNGTKVPAQNAKVKLYIIDPNEKEPIFVKEMDITDGSGFDNKLELGYDYQVTAEKQGFKGAPVTFSTKGAQETSTYLKDLVLKELPPKTEAFVLKNVYYELDKFELTAPSKIAIDTTLLVFLKKYPDVIIEISSHTDSIASDAYNQKLSKNRAKGVVDYVISKGVLPARLQPAGYGESRPIARNTNLDGTDNPEGRAKNRRTEIRIIGKLNDGDTVKNVDLDD
ncbi:MAG: OmpA family protein [Bacteroidia bacterium]